MKVRSRGRLATFRKMWLPVALELLEHLATVNIPQPDRLVVRPTDKQGGIRWVELDAIYVTAAIFSNVSFTGTNLRLSPAERGRQKEKSLANLWPSSVFRRSPFSGSHRMMLLSAPPLARSLPSKRQATDLTQSLPFSQMSGNTYVVVVYASPPLNLRLSPGDRAEGVDGNSDAYNTRIRGKERKARSPKQC